MCQGNEDEVLMRMFILERGKIFLKLIMVTVAKLCEYTKNQIVYFK